MGSPRVRGRLIRCFICYECSLFFLFFVWGGDGGAQIAGFWSALSRSRDAWKHIRFPVQDRLPDASVTCAQGYPLALRHPLRGRASIHFPWTEVSQPPRRRVLRRIGFLTHLPFPFRTTDWCLLGAVLGVLCQHNRLPRSHLRAARSQASVELTPTTGALPPRRCPGAPCH